MFLRDSWFSSIRAAKAVSLSGNYKILVIKTGFGRSPKKWLEEEMKYFPDGTWVVLEGTTSAGVSFVTIDYKYNQHKVLAFFLTKEAGSTIV